ncbi:MAG: hypothetical protein ACRCZS_26020 [Chroococcidiopsis sp.]
MPYTISQHTSKSGKLSQQWNVLDDGVVIGRASSKKQAILLVNNPPLYLITDIAGA